MRELAVRIDAARLEDVLDVLLPLTPTGVHDFPLGDGKLELRVRGAPAELPSRAQLEVVLAGDALEIVERDVPDDWRARRVLDYVPIVLAGRIVLRPEWAPPAGPGLLELTIPDAAVFGRGAHPTTRDCLRALLDLEPSGAFADLGCGSGVLAVMAAKLGWSPVFAVDHKAEAVENTQATAALNGVALDAREADLMLTPPPAAGTVAANMPAAVHVAVARAFAERPRVVLVSGILQHQVEEVLAAYAAAGLVVVGSVPDDDWPLVRLGPAAG